MTGQKHIFLCGFMGSGKSTYGKKLAGLIKRPFIDLDNYIQTKENKTIQFIFDNEGEDVFRTLETKYLKELIDNNVPHVISLGGGTVCFNNNIKFIKEAGVLVYIEMPVSVLAERLKKSRQKRPLLEGVKSDDLESYITQKLNERNKYYHQAHLTVNGLNLSHIQLQQLLFDPAAPYQL